jgi:hypothetical protein
LLIECHKVACVRKSTNSISLEELKTWVDGKEVMTLFNEVLADLLQELGLNESTEEKKR